MAGRRCPAVRRMTRSPPQNSTTFGCSRGPVLILDENCTDGDHLAEGINPLSSSGFQRNAINQGIQNNTEYNGITEYCVNVQRLCFI